MGVRVVNPTSSVPALQAKPYVTLTTDTEVADAILVETIRATSEEARIEQESKDRDDVLHQEVLDETARAEAEELRIDTKLDAEIARATANELRIENESKARDLVLHQEILDEQARAEAEELRIDTKLDAEIARATAEEARIEAESIARDNVLHQEILDETARAVGEETRIENESKQRDAVLHQEILNEEARAEAEELRIETESVQRDNTLHQEILDEEARATNREQQIEDDSIARDTALSARITAEEAARIAADAAEEAARIAADTNLQAQITVHVTNKNNPHETTLQQAANEQGAAPTVENGGIYESSNTAQQKLLTRAEVQAEIGYPVRYKGQVKYGAMTVSDMNRIRTTVPNQNLQNGDMCGCHETGLTYTYNIATGSWVANPQGTDTEGDLYDLLFWYGTWVDGITYNGEVSAQIKCKDGPTHAFDLVVLTDLLLDNEVTDPKIGNRILADQGADATLITVAAKNLTQWLQGIRNNLKWLFTNAATKAELATETASRIAADNNLQSQMDALKGFYVGNYADVASLPATGYRVGDWASVNNDGTSSNNALFVLGAKDGAGNNIWNQFFTIVANIPNLSAPYEVARSSQGTGAWTFTIPETGWYQAIVNGTDVIGHLWVKCGGVTLYTDYDEYNSDKQIYSPPFYFKKDQGISIQTYALNNTTALSSTKILKRYPWTAP